MSSEKTDKWQDDDVMTFGAHQGERLGDIPDGYLHWLWDQTWLEKERPGLYLYVKAFVEVVAKERKRR